MRTKSQRSAAARRGWQTRRSGGRHSAAYRRSNGDKFITKGFTPGEQRQLHEVFKRADTFVNPSVRVGKVKIKKGHIPTIPQRTFGRKLRAVTLDSRSSVVQDAQRSILAKRGKPANKVFLNTAVHIAGHRKYPTVYIGKDLQKRRQPAVIAHELGHIYDTHRRFSDTPQWHHAAGWQSTNVRHPGYVGGSYQGVSAREDFAETFRRGMGYDNMLNHPAVYNQNRHEFMRRNVWR